MNKTTTIKKENLSNFIVSRLCWFAIGCIILYIVSIAINSNNSSTAYKEQTKERQYQLIAHENYKNKLQGKLTENVASLDQEDILIDGNATDASSIISIEDKYSYAMYDTAGLRNDLTVELLFLGDQLMTECNLDPNLLFGIIMVESEGHADKYNTVSTAAGLGQFLPDTGKFVYNTYIDNTIKYDHNITPYNAECNLKMIVYYLDYLYDIHHGSTMDVIKDYCGGDDNFALSYYNRVCNEVGYCIN